jgi:hypothetical protein
MMINKRKLRDFALLIARGRSHKFGRVSPEFILRCEANLKAFIRGEIMRLPSKGKTIR